MQLIGHSIEVVGEILDLVGGLDVDAMAEITCLQLLCANLQRANWNDHLARHQHADEDGQEHAHDQQPRGTEQQAVDRLQRRAQRLLEKHEPVHPRYRRRGGQDRPPIGVLPEFHGLRPRLDHGGDLRKLAEIGAQAASGVGMREQPPRRLDDIGVVALADLIRHR